MYVVLIVRTSDMTLNEAHVFYYDHRFYCLTVCLTLLCVFPGFFHVCHFLTLPSLCTNPPSTPLIYSPSTPRHSINALFVYAHVSSIHVLCVLFDYTS